MGNKLDLAARREVQATIAQEWAQSQGMEYVEISAVSFFTMYNIVFLAFLLQCVKVLRVNGCLLLQKEKENSDVPLLTLARAFSSLYQQYCETVHNLSTD